MSGARDGGDRTAAEYDQLTTQLELGVPRSGQRKPEQRAYLIARRGAETAVLTVGEDESVVVGRAREAELTVEDARVSRSHARLSYRAGRLYIADLGSRNGTTVAGSVLRSEERALEHGDAVTIGPLELMIVAVPGAPRGRERRATPATRERAPDSAQVIVVDPRMQELYRKAQRVAAVATTVLLVGETGVGKEILAEVVHRHSPRRDGPLVRLNCGGVPESLIESELFGHEKGAFTGATAPKIGFIEAAQGGTLFLDEIGDLPLPAQTKLLRALETKCVQRLGTTSETAVDVRFVCATHHDLESAVAAGRFRQDLYYRVAAFTLEIPPLRERPTEIQPLAELFARRFAEQNRLPRPELRADARQALEGHSWPGNVRELRNALEHAVVLAEGASIGAQHLPRAVVESSARPPGDVASPDPATIHEQRDEAERRAVEEALAACNGNRGKTAERLGISRRMLQYKLAKFGLKR